MDSKEFILERIPHRPPFLWVDEVIQLENDTIIAQKSISEDLELFKGHYPHYPIMPGVILCEAVFQAGSLLISELIRKENKNDDAAITGVPVLTRITGAKFKREVRPGDTITLKVRLKEQVGPAWFLSGQVLVRNKTAVKVGFACALKQD
ncbi:MAG: beta-hydroxyacyl-ACP dehydratase [Desulfobulbaceae bacterium]|nr:beta-hydroxyacyl-ACP dehydratase [Desulfobulbaceae bacterium]